MANLLTGDNASFTSSIGTWDETTNPPNFTIAHSTADGGVLRAEVTTGGSNIAVASHPSSDATKVPVTAGSTITLGASSKQTNGTARPWRVEGNFYDSAGTTTGGGVITAATGTLTVGSYVTLSAAVTVPANSVRMRLRVRWDTPAAGEIFYLDNAVVDDAASGAVDVGNVRSYVLSGGVWVLQRADRIS